MAKLEKLDTFSVHLWITLKFLFENIYFRFSMFSLWSKVRKKNKQSWCSMNNVLQRLRWYNWKWVSACWESCYIDSNCFSKPWKSIFGEICKDMLGSIRTTIALLCKAASRLLFGCACWRCWCEHRRFPHESPKLFTPHAVSYLLKAIITMHLMFTISFLQSHSR